MASPIAWHCMARAPTDHAVEVRQAHLLGHSCAAHTLESTGDIRRVSLWLCHASIQSIEIFLRSDPIWKLRVLAARLPPAIRKGSFKEAPDRLLTILKDARRLEATFYPDLVSLVEGERLRVPTGPDRTSSGTTACPTDARWCASPARDRVPAPPRSPLVGSIEGVTGGPPRSRTVPMPRGRT